MAVASAGPPHLSVDTGHMVSVKPNDSVKSLNASLRDSSNL